MTERQFAVHNHVTAVPKDCHRHERFGNGSEGSDEQSEFRHFKMCADITGDKIFPFVDELRFDRQSFDGFDVRYGFDHEGIAGDFCAPDTAELASYYRHCHELNCINWDYAQRNQSQRYRIPEHETDKDERKERVKDSHQAGTGQKIADASQGFDTH